MYTFRDKKGRSLTLRPENTAPVMRAYLENGLHRLGGITRLFYIGPMFRYDRPQAGRYRQFHQVGAEAVGSANPEVDVEIIDISLQIYRRLGFDSLEVRLNSVGCLECRDRFLNILREELAGYREELCEDCALRFEANPLRVFDCKECLEVKEKLPVITDHLCEKCRNHFDRLRTLLDEMDIKYRLDPLLVRGLDYYTKTAFEIIHPGLGAQNALCGGGRYDGLAEELGGESIPAVGFSAGMERLLETMPDLDEELDRKGKAAYFVVFDEQCSVTAMKLAADLRDRGMVAEVDLSMRNIKKQLKTALDHNADFAVFVGEKEIKEKAAAVKELKSGEQENVSFERLAEYISREG
jgi:histidyl-tRNA synthetase